MRSTKVFISGRVTGLPRAEAVRNFERGKNLLMQNTYDFVNPLDLVPEGTDNALALKMCLDALFSCDGILLLNDHDFSEGSQIEELVARYWKKEFYYEDDLTQ